jgi:cytochrome c peroxidase
MGLRANGPGANASRPTMCILARQACVVHRLSQSEYRPLFETVWGSQAFRIDWPADTDQVCSRAVPPRTNAPGPVKLRQADRDRANVTYDQFGLAIRA